MINATNDSKPRELVPAGNQVARCYSMVHLGTNIEEYMGEKKAMNKVRISWELPEEMRVFDEAKGEQPMSISKEYTLSMFEKANLRKELEGWRGKGFTEEEAKVFDITKLLGKSCLLNIIHKTSKTGNEYAVINSISGLPKGMDCPKQINPTFEFNFQDKFDLKILESLPQFIRDKIKTSFEYKAINNPQDQDLTHDEVMSNNSEPENDLPF
jgi:hypothetical protein